MIEAITMAERLQPAVRRGPPEGHAGHEDGDPFETRAGDVDEGGLLGFTPECGPNGAPQRRVHAQAPTKRAEVATHRGEHPAPGSEQQGDAEAELDPRGDDEGHALGRPLRHVARDHRQVDGGGTEEAGGEQVPQERRQLVGPRPGRRLRRCARWAGRRRRSDVGSSRSVT